METLTNLHDYSPYVIVSCVFLRDLPRDQQRYT
jgi:hypothetical protein